MFAQNILELIRAAATNLPTDVVEALLAAKNRETNPRGKLTLGIILQNIALAKKLNRPLCQDTGSLTFFVKAEPQSWSKIAKAIDAATRKATKIGLLRPNSVDSVSGKNLGNIPKIEFESKSSSGSLSRREAFGLRKRGAVEISLLLKGGGSENVSAQVALPLETKSGLAGRDLAGVKKAALAILESSVGKGCPPGIVSIVIGGDRAEAFKIAKKNLLQKIGTPNSDSKLAKLEAEILRSINSSKIGPGGLGGQTTLLDCRIASLPRHPACFFVTLAYSCWATRRGKIILDAKGQILRNNYSKKLTHHLGGELTSVIEKAKKIQLPISEKAVRELRAGELVAISGRIFTARDQVHNFVVEGGSLTPELTRGLKGSGVFHAGPIAILRNKKWKIVAAGPTTSARLDVFTPKFLEKTGARVLIGKGGMGAATAQALQKFGAVYCHAIGGAAAFYADAIREVRGVDFLDEFGMPEALWELEVENMLAIVGMDARGGVIR
ncbi:MAG: FumA C-terminus/TtdB family hydratase beta subunit [Patescibacteria group bacterium]